MVRDTSSGGGLPTCSILKAYLERQKVTARTRFATDAGTDLTLWSKFKVKCHEQWHATHRLAVVYLHAKYAKCLERQTSYSPDTICYIHMDGRTDRGTHGRTD